MDNHKQFPNVPDRIKGLGDLAYNLWWSWHPGARDLFRAIDQRAWRESGHNPIELLGGVPAEQLERIADDEAFLARYDGVMSQFDVETSSNVGWFTGEYGRLKAPLAYFSAEYGLHGSLRIYAGGLGILAGDHLKECSDLAVPVVGIGLIYTRGYVWQRIREDGWQEDVEEPLDRTPDPIEQLLDDEGKPLTIQVPVFDPPVHVAVWKASVGRVCLYLLDPDVPVNQPWDRAIAHNLYANDIEQRLRQEIILGMGGMRVLRALGKTPAAIHLNEGHPAFAVIERLESAMTEGRSFDEAVGLVRRSTIFTTHTPVRAGTDVFPFGLMEKYFSGHLDKIGVSHEQFLQLGINPEEPNAGFNMTVFALRMASFANGVSKKHGAVARKMWHVLWPDRAEDDVPITSITNGVHLRTWFEAKRLQSLLSQHLGTAWIEQQDQEGIWEGVRTIPDEALWAMHEARRASLIAVINERIRNRWKDRRTAGGSVVGFGALLDPHVFTVGFCRRITGYKRADLILRDVDRLKQMLNDPWRPMQIIFSGLAHPADLEGKRLIQKIVQLAQDPEYAGRIAFVENYDQHVAHYLVSGVDVWLNNPVPPLEASGTSGMKASINGVPHLSISDGWWAEGYTGENGWSFGEEPMEGDRTRSDADALYALLKDKVIPLFYERGDDGIPHGFVKVMKEAIRTVAPKFSARRMVREYVETCYLPALGLNEPEVDQAER